MIKITIIGTGNVGQHLIKAFTKSTFVTLFQVYSRNEKMLNNYIDSNIIVSDFADLKEADLFIIAVSDIAIAEVSAKLPFKNQLIVHTSGSVSLDALGKNNRNGVFYPLQTFSKNKPIDFKTIPICLETKAESDYNLLEKVAQSISNTVYKIDSEQRKSLHVAAVFVCNFVNHLYQIGNEICDAHQVPFEILNPLIIETAQKIENLSAKAAQTGPASRNDTTTIAAHQAFLNDTNQKKIYKLLTESIQNNGKKL
jgi:predicted short-subunit dehydrogenase-like oxidoreductase (DUF2520 family)